MKWLAYSWFWFSSLIIATPYQCAAQNHLQDNEYHYRLFNGLDVYFIKVDTDPLITLSLTIKAGVFADVDSLHGIIYAYNKVFSDDLANWASANGVVYKNVFERERVTYIFQFPPSFIDSVLEMLYEKLLKPAKVTPANIPTSMHVGVYPFGLPESFMERGQKMLWNEFYLRTSLAADSLPKDTAAIRQVYGYFYGADNALLLIRGNISDRNLFPKLENTISGWKGRRHDYLSEEPVPYPKDMKFSSQFIEESNDNQKPTFVIWFRGPNSRQDIEYYRLSPLLEETIRVALLSKAFMDTSHIANLHLHMENSRYATQIMVHMVPDSVHADSAYFNLFQFFRYSGEGKIFIETDMEKAKTNLLEDFERIKKYPVSQANLFSDFWISSSIDDYSLYADRLKSVTVKQLFDYVNTYISNKHYISGLYINKNDRSVMKADTFFTNTFNIEDYRFIFFKNNADLSDTTQDTLVRSLAQKIKINPNMVVMLNGVAAKDELLHFNDADMYKFTEKHPGFVITPSSLISNKKYRLDVYRSLTVIRMLIQMGVSENQLTGTGKIVDPGTMQPLPDQQVYGSLNMY